MDSESNKSNSLQVGLGIFIVLGLIASFLLWQNNVETRRAKSRAFVRSVNNARQIGLALMEFENDYGSFPDEKTASMVTKNDPRHGFDLSGISSNALFRQLFAAGLAQTEQIFHAQVPGVRRPDDDISPGKALEKGEVGFAIITSLSSAGNPARPAVLAPLIPGTKRFDPRPFGGDAILLRIDNSARRYKIHEDGHIYEKGIDILSQKHPMWGGVSFKIHYPE
jgi:hypothetical protein